MYLAFMVAFSKFILLFLDLGLRHAMLLSGFNVTREPNDWQQVLYWTSVCYFSIPSLKQKTVSGIWKALQAIGSFIPQNNMIWVSIKNLVIWWNTGKRQPWFPKDLQSNTDIVILCSRFVIKKGGKGTSLLFLERASWVHWFQGDHSWGHHVCDDPVDLGHLPVCLSSSVPFLPMSWISHSKCRDTRLQK